MNLNILKILKKSLMRSILDSVKSWDLITVHNPFFSFIPNFCLLAPKKLHFALTHLQILLFFHCRGNMIKINTLSMGFSKTYCLFHFQTKIFFFLFFHMVNIWPPKKMQFACKYF